MTRSVIFLDIDGVLAPILSPSQYSDIEPACMQVLNDIVARSGAEVVVSSSLRHGKSIADLQELLESGGFVGRIIDKTPTETRGLTRGEEIEIWLAANPVDSCVILDDHRDMGELLVYLVQTRSAKGLQPSDVDRALEKLAIPRIDDALSEIPVEA